MIPSGMSRIWRLVVVAVPVSLLLAACVGRLSPEKEGYLAAYDACARPRPGDALEARAIEEGRRMLADVLGDGFTMGEALAALHWNARQHASLGSVPLSPRAQDAARRWERPVFPDSAVLSRRRSTLRCSPLFQGCS